MMRVYRIHWPYPRAGTKRYLVAYSMKQAKGFMEKEIEDLNALRPEGALALTLDDVGLEDLGVAKGGMFLS